MEEKINIDIDHLNNFEQKIKRKSIGDFIRTPIFDIQRQVDEQHLGSLCQHIYNEFKKYGKISFINLPIIIKNKKKVFKDKNNKDVNKILIDGQHRRRALEIIINKERCLTYLLTDDEIKKIKKQKIYINYILANDHDKAKEVYLTLYKANPFTQADLLQLHLDLNKNIYKPKEIIEELIKNICLNYKHNHKQYNLIKGKRFKTIYTDKLKTELSSSHSFLKLITKNEINSKTLLEILNELNTNINNEINYKKENCNNKEYKKYIKETFGNNNSWIKNVIKYFENNNISNEELCIQYFHPESYTYFLNQKLTDKIRNKYIENEDLF